MAGWCPAHLRVPEEFDHMGLPRQRRPEIRPRARPRGGRAVRACPRDVERDVKGGEGEAEREDLKADQVRGQDRGRFNEGELVRLVGDEVAMLLRRPRLWWRRTRRWCQGARPSRRSRPSRGMCRSSSSKDRRSHSRRLCRLHRSSRRRRSRTWSRSRRRVAGSAAGRATVHVLATLQPSSYAPP